MNFFKKVLDLCDIIEAKQTDKRTFLMIYNLS